MNNFEIFVKEYMNGNKMNDSLKDKFDWLNSIERYSHNTKLTYWKACAKHIVPYENNLGKNIVEASKDELVDFIKNLPSVRPGSKEMALKVVTAYADWKIGNGTKKTPNICGEVDIHSLDLIDTKKAKDVYVSLDNFYEWTNSLNESSNVEKMIFTLLRYGVDIKHVGEITLRDVNEENMTLNYNNGKFDLSFPIDKRFVEMAKKASECTHSFEGYAYVDNDRLIKTQTNMKKIVYTSSMLYNKITVIFEKNNIKRISVLQLNSSRKIDLLDKIYEEVGKVTVNDLKKVIITLTGRTTPSITLQLRRNFESFKGGEIKVDTFRTRRK